MWPVTCFYALSKTFGNHPRIGLIGGEQHNGELTGSVACKNVIDPDSKRQ